MMSCGGWQWARAGILTIIPMFRHFYWRRIHHPFLVEPNSSQACTQHVTVGNCVKQDNALTKTVNTNTNVYIATRNMPLKHVQIQKQAKLPTPINLEQLSFLLKIVWVIWKHSYYQVLLLGFHLGSNFNKSSAMQCKNHKSALDNRVIAAEKIRNERDKGRYKGPFEHPPFSKFISSPLGLIQKKRGR